MKINVSTFLLVCLSIVVPVFIITNPAIAEIYATHPYLLPRGWNWALIVLAIGLAWFVRNPITKVIYVLWSLWVFFGTANILTNIIEGRFSYGRYAAYPDTYNVNNIQSIYVIFFGVGIILFETAFKTYLSNGLSKLNDNGLSLQKVDSISFLLLVIFPFAYIVTLQRSVGYIPIFSGRDITYDIYELDYGFMYRFAPALTFTLFMILHRVLASGDTYLRWIYISLMGLVSLISIADGKRRVIIGFALGAIILSIVHNRGKIANKGVLLSGGFLFIAAMSVVLMRSNTEVSSIGWLKIIGFVGDEYWEFARSYSLYSTEAIRSVGFDLVKSTFASIINTQILELFGIVKTDWVALDSGASWARIMGSEVGIRTGIVSELWYAFQWWGLVPISLLGALISWLSSRVLMVRTELGMGLILGLLGLLATAINGQLSVLTGRSVSLLYAYIFLVVFGILARKFVLPLVGQRSLRPAG